ncbi:MAG: 3-hydroxyacyl-CoA dehydrogenase [Acidobacteriaceae bacterium]
MAANATSSSLALSADIDVGVVGAGAMGAGIAQVAALAGHRVRLFDTRTGAAQAAVERIAAIIQKLLAKGRVTEQQATAVRNNLRAIDSLTEFANCGLIIEAIVENLEAKRTLLRGLEEIVDAEALLATNTSSISITSIASGLRHPARVLGMHFFNPAPLMPLVEIVSGTNTTQAAAETLHATATQWGKVPVYARSSPGFIVNRVARPFYAEALRVLNERASDCATIDAVLRESGGFRMGPFELMDLIGNDVNYAVTRSVFDAFYADPRFTPSLLQLELVEAGFLGHKTGRGFYIYGDNAPPIVPRTFDPAPTPTQIRLFGSNAFTNALAERLTHASQTFERANTHSDGRLAECDACAIYATDGRTATAHAAANSIANTVLLDLALDYDKATRLAITPADQSDEHALTGAAGLLQAAGYAVSSIDDIPGMIVLRTVAMLANEAADAVNHGVCSAADCDLAMRKGVNYPKGPLAWADSLGLATIVTALENIGNAYGEDRYRISPLLRRKALSNASFSERITS